MSHQKREPLDLKVREASGFDSRGLGEVRGSLRSAGVEALSGVFDRAVRRIYNLASLPWLMVYLTTELEHATCLASFDALGRVDVEPASEEDRAKVREEQRRVGEKNRFAAQMLTAIGGHPGAPDYTKRLLAAQSARAGRHLGELVGGFPQVGDGIHAIIYAQVLTAWTAYESLATDLWVRAVNERPRSLAANVVQVRGTGGSRPKGDQEPSVRFSDLADEGFDLSRSMGTFLRQAKRVDFESLGGIEAAYRDAFRLPEDKNRRTSGALSAILDKHHARLAALQEVRNLIAHRGGVVDEKFRRAVERHDPALHAVPVGESLPLDGATSAAYTQAVVDAGTDLLAFVDGWLAKYAE